MSSNQSTAPAIAGPFMPAPAPAPSGPTPAVAGSPELRPFLQRPLPVGIILASFLVVTLPLTLMDFLGANETVNTIFFRTYHITFSITHFFLTLWLYFDVRNFEYFTSSWRNRALYFGVPIAILIGMAVLGFLRLDPAFGEYAPMDSFGPMAYAFLFAFIVRALDYRHSTRQSFGVLQMMKVQPGARYPAWSKAVDNWFFAALCLLELMTFAYGGRFTPSNLMLVSVAVTAALFIGVLAGFVQASRGMPDRRVLLAPLTYFLFQTTAACLVVYSFELYAISLAMHFTEYHALMAPRAFERKPKAEAEAASPQRKVFFLRRSWIAAYAVLLVLSLAYYTSYFMEVTGVRSESQVVWAMTNMFNGIFLAHFFLESLVWKFSTPFYRTSLGPLFFPRRAA